MSGVLFRGFITAPLGLVALACAVSYASAQTPAPDSAGARYSFERRDDGFVRLDRVTGQMSYCAPRTAGWACQAMPDERAALDSEIARLQDENAALKKQVAAAELVKPESGKPPDARKGYRVPDTLRLPTNEDIDRAVAYAEKIWRRLIQMVDRLNKDVHEKI